MRLRLSYPGLTFQEKGHVYMLNGTILPSVNQILSAQNLRGWESLDELPDIARRNILKGMKRGTLVHQAIHYWNENDLNMKTLDDSLRPYVNQWAEWVKKSGFKPLASEVRMYRDEPGAGVRYAGTCDVIGTFGKRKNQIVVVDAKTGRKPPVCAGIQLAGYVQCLPPSLQRKAVRLVVSLDGDTIARERPCDNQFEYDIWEGAARNYQWATDAYGPPPREAQDA